MKKLIHILYLTLLFLTSQAAYCQNTQPIAVWYKVSQSTNEPIWSKGNHLALYQVGQPHSILLSGFTNQGANVRGTVEKGRINIPKQTLTIYPYGGGPNAKWVITVEAHGKIKGGKITLNFYLKQDTFPEYRGKIIALKLPVQSDTQTQGEQPFSLKTTTPFVIQKKGNEIFQYWELQNESFLWDTNFVQAPSLKLYIDSVHNILGEDLFKRISQELAFQNISYKVVSTKNGDSINAQLIHSKAVGKIRPINNLEAQLLEYQINRYPLLSHPTEFHGFILFHDSLKQIKVYFAASDQPWPPKPAVILNAIKTDLKNGWTFKYHLHNHYEPKSHHYLGILAPSMTDVQYYLFLKEEYNLKQSIITNGIYTVELKSEEFTKLKSPE